MHGEAYGIGDLKFERGLPEFSGSVRVKAVLDRQIPGGESLKQDIMWNLADPGNADLVEFVIGGRFESRTENFEAVLRQLANPGMVPAVRMTFKEAAKLLASGAHVVFEPPKPPNAPKADLDLATVAGSFHDVTRAELESERYREARDDMVRWRSRHPGITYQFLCSDES
jgi:hypothetical protein